MISAPLATKNEDLQHPTGLVFFCSFPKFQSDNQKCTHIYTKYAGKNVF